MMKEKAIADIKNKNQQNSVLIFKWWQQMTISPGFLKSLLIYISGSCIIAKSTLFHSQKYYRLDNKLCDHLSNKKLFNSLKNQGQRSRIRMISSELHFTKTHHAVLWDLHSKREEIRQRGEDHSEAIALLWAKEFQLTVLAKCGRQPVSYSQGSPPCGFQPCVILSHSE